LRLRTDRRSFRDDEPGRGTLRVVFGVQGSVMPVATLPVRRCNSLCLQPGGSRPGAPLRLQLSYFLIDQSIVFASRYGGGVCLCFILAILLVFLPDGEMPQSSLRSSCSLARRLVVVSKCAGGRTPHEAHRRRIRADSRFSTVGLTGTCKIVRVCARKAATVVAHSRRMHNCFHESGSRI
jgi:hypothetical protein